MKVLKFFGKLFAVLFSIIYYFMLTTLIIASLVMNLVSGSYYANILENVNLNDIKIEELGDIFEDANLPKNASLQDALITFFTKGGVSEEVAISIIENKEIRHVIGKFFGDFVNYSFGGEKPKIERKDVETVLNNPDVVKLLEKSSTEVDVDKIYEQLNELVDKLVEDGGSNNGNYERTSNNNISY